MAVTYQKGGSETLFLPYIICHYSSSIYASEGLDSNQNIMI